MNQLKNGSLIAIIATVVTAVLILMTGRDTPTTLSENNDVAVVENDASLEVEPSVVTASEEIVIDTSVTSVESADVQNLTGSLNESVKVEAPKGPFSKTSSDQAITESLDSEASNQELITETEVLVEKDTTAQAVKVESNNTMTKLPQLAAPKNIQPIWMDQKLGDFKGIDQGEVVFKIMPTSADGLQGKDPVQVVTSKNDKFAPLTVSEDYNYQQMPMYNGGYYIAPMPSYLMSSVPPKSHSK